MWLFTKAETVVSADQKNEERIKMNAPLINFFMFRCISVTPNQLWELKRLWAVRKYDPNTNSAVL